MYTHRSKVLPSGHYSELSKEGQPHEQLQLQLQLYRNLLLDCLMVSIAMMLTEYKTNLSANDINNNDTAIEINQEDRHSPILYTIIHASDVTLRSRIFDLKFSESENINSYEVDLVFLDKLVETGFNSDSDRSLNIDLQNTKDIFGTTGEYMESKDKQEIDNGDRKANDELGIQQGKNLAIDKLDMNVNLFLLAGQSNMSGFTLYYIFGVPFFLKLKN